MKVVIIGNSDFAKLMQGYIEDTEGMELVAFSVEEKYISSKKLKGLPVISYEEIADVYDTEEVRLVMAVGYAQMGDVKKRLFEMYRSKGYMFTNYIHPSVIIPNDLVIGTGNSIFEGTIICRQSSIGNCNLLWGGSLIGHDNVIGDYNTLSACVTTNGKVVISDNCFLGSKSVVRNGVHLSSYVLVGATAYVDQDLPENSVVLPPKGVVMEGKGAKLLCDKI